MDGLEMLRSKSSLRRNKSVLRGGTELEVQCQIKRCSKQRVKSSGLVLLKPRSLHRLQEVQKKNQLSRKQTNTPRRRLLQWQSNRRRLFSSGQRYICNRVMVG